MNKKRFSDYIQVGKANKGDKSCSPIFDLGNVGIGLFFEI